MVFQRSWFQLACCNSSTLGEVGDGVFGFPGVQGWDDTWFLKSTLPSIPAQENHLQLWSWQGSRWGRPLWRVHSRTLPGWTTTSALFSEPLSVMNSVDVTTFAVKQEPGSRILLCSLLTWILGILTGWWALGIQLHHPCEHPASWLMSSGVGWDTC